MDLVISTKYRNERSYNQFTLDVLKSAIQKYIRRGETEKAIYAALEMWMFKCVLKKGSRAGGILTNFVHRLQIIYLEDVGIGSIIKQVDGKIVVDTSIWKCLDLMIDSI